MCGRGCRRRRVLLMPIAAQPRMTVGSVSSTTPVLYHNHHSVLTTTATTTYHLALLTTQYRLHTVLCIIIQPLHRSSLQGCQSRLLLLLPLISPTAVLHSTVQDTLCRPYLHAPWTQQSAAYCPHIYPGRMRVRGGDPTRNNLA